MRLLHRMGFQLRADAHGLMDDIEDRGLLMKQHLREAELELDRKRAHLESLEAQARQVGEAAERAGKEIQRLDADVELALQGGEDELARFALRQLLPLRRAHETLALRREEITREHERCAETLGRQTQVFERLRERVNARLASLEADWPEGSAPASGPAAGVAEEEIEIELLRRRTARDRPAPAERPTSAERPADRARAGVGSDAGEEA